ncbi:TonB-dependent receptor plug domain-containing protein [Membranihabitans marinus]|uniref:TonB-dependent receptor plug domain-containing protein n=1 Tax=Membranihabitans marinus TaxID=1227546 RepID=UPI001F39D4EC|nr:TonB-dependent receptor [Membranihabitans marinus]
MYGRATLVLVLLCTISRVIGQDSLHFDSIAWNLKMDEFVVTAQYQPTHYSQAMHKVSVIDGQTIQKMGVSNLSEVLLTQLNMQVSTDLVLGNGLKMQGIGGENILILQDGIPVIGRLDGNIDLSQIPMTRVKRIEIVQGAMSAQYGSNASGGVINIISDQSTIKGLNIESRNVIESVGVLDNGLGISKQWGKWYGEINGRRYHSQLASSDSLRIYEVIDNGGIITRTKKYPWNPKYQYSGDGTLKYQITDSSSIRYKFRYLNEEVKNMGEVRRPVYKPYAFDDYYYTERIDHSVYFSGYLGPKLFFTSNNGYNSYNRNLETIRMDFDESLETTLAESLDTTTYHSLLSRNFASIDFSDRWSGQLGLEYLYETAQGNRIKADSTRANKQINYGGWISSKYKLLPSLDVQGHLRYGYNSTYDHPLIPAANLLWRINPQWNARVSYAHGFRAPNLKEMLFEFIDINHYIVGNAELGAEHSKNMSLDITGQIRLWNRKTMWTTSIFNNIIENKIILAEFDVNQYTYQNISEFESHGLNSSMEIAFSDRFQFQSAGSWTRLYNIYSDISDANRFTNVFEWQNNLSYRIPGIESDFYIFQKWTSQQQRYYLGENNVVEEGRIGGMNMVNLSVSKSLFNTSLFLSLGVKNLLDIQSISVSGTSGSAHSSTSSQQLVDWGRSYFFKLNYRFTVDKD